MIKNDHNCELDNLKDIGLSIVLILVIEGFDWWKKRIHWRISMDSFAGTFRSIPKPKKMKSIVISKIKNRSLTSTEPWTTSSTTPKRNNISTPEEIIIDKARSRPGSLTASITPSMHLCLRLFAKRTKSNLKKQNQQKSSYSPCFPRCSVPKRITMSSQRKLGQWWP